MKKISLDDVINIMEESPSGAYGFRGASVHDLDILKESEYLDKSLDLFDERDCKYNENAGRLTGTSAISINPWMEIEELKSFYNYTMGYAKNHHETGVVLFLHGDVSEFGDDEYEVVISNFGCAAKVIGYVDEKNKDEMVEV